MLSPELMELTTEIQRKVGITDLTQARNLRLEMMLLEVYGRIPTVEDAKFSDNYNLNIDWGEKRVRLLFDERSPIRVWSSELAKADIFVISWHKDEIAGWIDLEQVEESPVDWYIKYEKRQDYFHQIHRDALLPVRSKDDAGGPFSSNCTHGAGYWDYINRAWVCFGCDKLRYDSSSLELIERQDAERLSSASSEASQVEEESQREESESRLRPEPELREQGGMF